VACGLFTSLRDDRRVVIPVHDQNPVHRTPVVTYVLLLANIAVFLFGPIGLSALDGMTVSEACATDAYLQEYAAVPRELTTGQPLPPQQTIIETDRGRVECPVVQVDKSPFLSVLTAMFLHGGWAHLLGNMLFLYVFGNNVEDRLGRLRYLFFYLGCGYVATYFFAFTNPSSTATLVGASGDRGRARRLSLDVPAGPGVEPGAVLLLHPVPAPGLAGARLLVPAPVALLPWHRHGRR
jgi:membrane associated rhomboid family serine protease